MHVANFLFKFIIVKDETNEHCDMKNLILDLFIMFSFIYQFEIIILINIFIFEGL